MPKNSVLDLVSQLPDAPRWDGRFAVDLPKDGKPLTVGVVKMINSGAGTINQVGLMSDGTVWDPTGGLADIQNRLHPFGARVGCLKNRVV